MTEQGRDNDPICYQKRKNMLVELRTLDALTHAISIPLLRVSRFFFSQNKRKQLKKKAQKILQVGVENNTRWTSPSHSFIQTQWRSRVDGNGPPTPHMTRISPNN